VSARHETEVLCVGDEPIYYGSDTPVIGKKVTLRCKVSGVEASGVGVRGVIMPRDPVKEGATIAARRLGRGCKATHDTDANEGAT